MGSSLLDGVLGRDYDSKPENISKKSKMKLMSIILEPFQTEQGD